MWLCEGKLKLKTAHFRLPSASQKRACLSSLLTAKRNGAMLVISGASGRSGRGILECLLLHMRVLLNI